MGWGAVISVPAFALRAISRIPAPPRPVASDTLNWDAVTIQDCIDMHEMKGLGAELDGGHVTGFTSGGKGLEIVLLYKGGKRGAPG